MAAKLLEKYIPEEWGRVKLGEICDIKKGEQLNKLDMVNGAQYPALNGGINPSGYTQNWNAEANTITISEGGNSCGFVNFMTTRFWCGGHCYSLLNQIENLDNNFLYQALKAKQSDLMGLRVGSGLPNIQKKSLEDFPLELPPITEQKKIAEILSTVDEEIQKIDSIILEANKLKTGLMHDLFTKGSGHKKFKKTKIGSIPEGWLVKTLVEVAKVERGKFSHRPRNAPEFYGGNIPFIQTGDVVSSNGKISSYTQTLNEKGLSVSRLFKKGTIVITIAANIGDTGILQFDSCFPDSLIGITPSEEIDPVFLEYYLRTQKKYLNSISTQSAQKNVNLEKLNPLLIVLPPKDEQKRIVVALSLVDKKIVVGRELKLKLLELKKGLMCDLLNGKVRVR